MKEIKHRPPESYSHTCSYCHTQYTYQSEDLVARRIKVWFVPTWYWEVCVACPICENHDNVGQYSNQCSNRDFYDAYLRAKRGN